MNEEGGPFGGRPTNQETVNWNTQVKPDESAKPATSH